MSASAIAGTWSCPELSLELAESGGIVTGALVLGGLRMPVRAQLQGATLIGSFEADGNGFPFAGRLEGDELAIESEGVGYRLRRPAAPRVNPLHRAGAAAASPAPAAPPPPAAHAGAQEPTEWTEQPVVV